MNYVLTGATGFLGTRLVNRLLKSGHGVIYLGRRRSETMDSRAAFHPWDLKTPPPLNDLAQVDAVVHLAGESVAQRWTEEVKEKIYASRVEGTRNLVRGFQKPGHSRVRPPVLISASAVGFYGDREDETLTERSRPGTGFLPEVCQAWEQEAEEAEALGVRVVRLRIGIVLGPEGGALKAMLPAFRLGAGGTFGGGHQWMPWIHVEDLVSLIIFAAERETLSGPLNGTSPNPVTNSVLTQELATTLHRPSILPIPTFALKVLFGEMAGTLVSSTRAVPEVAQAAQFSFAHPHLGEALRDLLG